MAVDVVFRILTVLVFLKGCCYASDCPANFVFGDSLVDVGNNNYIATLSRANYVPNGIDFGSPTGRFTNNRTIVDIIGQELRLPGFTPPYLAPTTKGPVILHGVNYASGAGGILNKTGFAFGGRLNMDAQLNNFENTRQDIVSSIGASEAQALLENALFSITMGSNDIINNYLVPVLSAPEQNLVSPELFVTIMIETFRLQLIRLYNLGARKVIVINIGPLGCIPYERDLNPEAGEDCVALPNQLAQSYNTKLRSLVEELSTSLKESKFVYANVYDIFQDILQNYQSYGIENTTSACCYAAGRHGGTIPCLPTSKVCPNRSKYVFWDPYHPTDAFNVIVAKRLLDGDSDDISPMNVRQLVAL